MPRYYPTKADENSRPPLPIQSRLKDAKAALTIPDVWSRLSLQGEPSESCRSPFREDHSPSFSVYENGTRWKDHATGEGGDVCDFVAAACNCSQSEAAKWIIEEAGSRPAPRPKPKPKPRKKMEMPALEIGTAADLDALARLRNLPGTDGLKELQDRQMLFFVNRNDAGEKVRAWLVTDPSGRNAQERRLDGKPWQHLETKPKAKTLAGAEAAWPIGAACIGESDTIHFCEGSPDLLAAATLAADSWDTWAPVCMIGGSLSIHPEALQLFKGKSVCIYAHNDEPGIAAARKWAKQLEAAGATVSGKISEREGRDLNDALSAGEITTI